jgi:hypothetical protein
MSWMSDVVKLQVDGVIVCDVVGGGDCAGDFDFFSLGSTMYPFCVVVKLVDRFGFVGAMSVWYVRFVCPSR